MYIQTVKGKIDTSDLGVTMSHEHLSVDLSKVRGNDDSTFGYSDFIINEINMAKEYGVKSYIELTTNDMGRNVEDLLKLSEECDIHIVAATGFYMDPYHPKEFDNMTAEDISDIFVKELTIGIDDTGIKAGIIGEVASSEVMTTNERKVLNAAAIAQKKVGCSISTHCQLGTLALEQIKIFDEHKVEPRRVVLGHIDLSDDLIYMTEILEKGYNIGFDTIGKNEYLKDSQRVNNLMELIKQGYQKQIVISQDISRKSYFTDEGYYGYTTVMKKFIPKLLESGISQEALDDLLINNPARIFTFE